MLLVPSFTGFGSLPADVYIIKHGTHTQNHAMQMQRCGAGEAVEKRKKLPAEKQARHGPVLLVDHGSDSLEKIEAELTMSLTSYLMEMEAELTTSLMSYLAEMDAESEGVLAGDLHVESDVERSCFEAGAISIVGDAGEAAAFEAAVQLCEAYERGPKDQPLSSDVPALLRRTFDADFAALLLREKAVQNVTCMQPRDEGQGYELFDDALKALPLKPGRVCEGGACGEACSRVTFPDFITPEESVAFRMELEAAITPPEHHFELTK